MKYFTTETTQFLKELEENNNRDWFNDNKKRFETQVKKPFSSFVDDLIIQIQGYEPDILIEAKDAIFRLNRDIRFSKDKSPYKTYISALISKFGRKDKEYPGLYFQISSSKVEIYSGAYMLPNPELYKIRSYIAEHSVQFKEIYSSEDFVQKYGSIQGEKNKKLPPEFKEIVVQEPLIANKQFYIGAELNTEILFCEDLIEIFMTYYLSAKPLNEFLKKALAS